VNCLETSIMLVQRGSKEILEIAPYQAEGWHKARASVGTSVQLRSLSTLWSLGSVDLNEVGRSALHLPRKGLTPSDPPFVVHVEVKIAEPTDHCSVVVVIWQACVETSTALSIRNDSDVSVTVKQADIDFEHMGIDRSLFETSVAPGQSVPFGWADPDCGSDILVTAGASAIGSKLRLARLNFLKAGEQLRLPSSNSGRIGFQSEVVLSVLAEGGGRVLRVTRSTELGLNSRNLVSETVSAETNTTYNDSEVVKSFGVSFCLASFGLSLVVEKPVRREFLSLYIDGLEGRVKTKGAIRSFEFMIVDLQIDNYSETAVYPVLLHSKKKEVHKSVDLLRNDTDDCESVNSSKSELGALISGEVPLLQMTLVEETQRESATSSSILKYVAIRYDYFIYLLVSCILYLICLFVFFLFLDSDSVSIQQHYILTVSSHCIRPSSLLTASLLPP
jgi:SHR-binding domain of vacuolar-sorting associated protein 13